MQKIAELLRENNIKVTPQRIAIYNILYHTNEHPSAENIYTALQPTHPTMSLATVYKTLDAFKKAELVQEINTSGESSRYDAKVTNHPHAVCKECGKVFDIFTDKTDDIIDRVQPETEFEITTQQIFFYGKCKDCK